MGDFNILLTKVVECINPFYAGEGLKKKLERYLH